MLNNSTVNGGITGIVTLAKDRPIFLFMCLAKMTLPHENYKQNPRVVVTMDNAA